MDDEAKGMVKNAEVDKGKLKVDVVLKEIKFAEDLEDEIRRIVRDELKKDRKSKRGNDG